MKSLGRPEPASAVALNATPRAQVAPAATSNQGSHQAQVMGTPELKRPGCG